MRQTLINHAELIPTTRGHMKPMKRWVTLSQRLLAGGLALLVVEPAARAINEPPGCQAVSITTNPVSVTRCLGSSASFSVAATGSLPLYYQWLRNGATLTDGGSVSGSSTPALLLTGLSAGDNNSSYKAVVSNVCTSVPSSATSSSATLTVNTTSSLTAVINGPSETCFVSTNTYSGTSGSDLSYTWSVSGQGAIVGAANGQTVSVASSASGSYTLALTVNSGACTDSTSETVTIIPAWADIYGPRAVCALSPNIYDAPEAPDLDYSWSITGDGTIIGATSDQSIFVLAGTNGSYTLSLAISEDGVCTSTASQAVSIYNAALIVTQPVSQVACSGSITFSVTATGGSLSYQWQQNGVNLTNDANISGATSATLTISNVGSYFGGSPVSNTVPATSGTGVSFGSVVGGRTYEYQATGCAGFNSSGGVSDPNGNVYSGSCTNAFLQRTAATNGFVCPGLTAYSLVGEIGSTCIQLGANGSFVAPVSGTLMLYYNDNTFTNTSGSFTAVITPVDMAATYDVVVTSDCNTETSVPATLSLVPAPSATLKGDAYICSNQSTIIRADLTGHAPWSVYWTDGTYQYIPVSPALRTVSPTSTTTYAIYELYDASCGGGSGSSVTVTVIPNSFSSGTVATPTFSPPGGDYLSSVTVTVRCATSSAGIYYTTNGLMPTMDDPSITSGSTVTLGRTSMLQARAFESGYCASSVAAALYQIGPLMAAGEYDSFYVQTNGIVWGWGDNTFAEITTNDYYIPAWYEDNPPTVYTLAPTIILSNVCALSAGGAHTLAITTNGTVWSWGCGYDGNGNFYNGLGIANYNLFSDAGGGVGPLALVANLSNVVSVAASPVSVAAVEGGSARFYDFSLVLKTNGTVWAWGDNSYGELGVGNSYVAEDVAYEDGESWVPAESLTPTQTVALSGVVAIAAGGDVGMALCSNGTVWVWGDYTDAFYNSYAALQAYANSGTFDTSESTGMPMQVNGLSNIVAIAVGYQHGMALDQNGLVWTWGWDSQGQLGTGDTYTNNTHGWPPMQVPGLNNVISIAAGDYHSVAVTASGQVYTWGANTDTNLTQQIVQGQLGTGTSSNYVSTPQLVSGLSRIQSASAADAHTLALGTYDGVYLVWGWGDNTRLQLGGVTNAYVMTPVLVPLPFDTDGDGIPDWEKYELGINPLNPYGNADGLLNGVNFAIGFNPLNVDLNSDSYSNAYNIVSGINPFDPSSYPDQRAINTFPVITLIEPAGAVKIY